MGTETGDLAGLFGDVLVDGDEDELDETARQGRFSILVPNDTEMEESGWRFGYENESAKLHLALLYSELFYNNFNHFFL